MRGGVEGEGVCRTVHKFWMSQPAQHWEGWRVEGGWVRVMCVGVERFTGWLVVKVGGWGEVSVRARTNQ